ncbi:m7GpppN-mRNA hydrolase-like isoform X2 [Panonychus citri]|nr:m7GpppN-mRNA hydrolase-like isoform X2 [Panonychus citri]
MFQIEQAHWFYIDFLSVQRPSLPKLQLRVFARIMFNHVPFLKIFLKEFENYFKQWKEYKSNVPTYGAILLDDIMEHVLMVQGFCSQSSWGFPKGKVNAEEDPVLCACREVKEETGFDCSRLIKSEDYIELKIRDTNVRLYIVPGVAKSEKFVTQTRGEIKDIKWFPLSKLPTNKSEKDLNANLFFMAIPFIKHLKRWIIDKRKLRQEEGRQILNVSRQQHSQSSITKFWSKSWNEFTIDWNSIWGSILGDSTGKQGNG